MLKSVRLCLFMLYTNTFSCQWYIVICIFNIIHVLIFYTPVWKKWGILCDHLCCLLYINTFCCGIFCRKNSRFSSSNYYSWGEFYDIGATFWWFWLSWQQHHLQCLLQQTCRYWWPLYTPLWVSIHCLTFLVEEYTV